MSIGITKLCIVYPSLIGNRIALNLTGASICACWHRGTYQYKGQDAETLGMCDRECMEITISVSTNTQLPRHVIFTT